MADNTTVGATGDVVRDLDRQSGGVKTQVMQLDQGGSNSNAESLVSRSNPLAVTHGNAGKTLTTTAIGSTATLALAANTSRRAAYIANPSAGTTLYLGPSGVTISAYSLALAPGGTLIDSDTTDAWYGVVASGSLTINVTEVS